jgi:hypothetical protein
MSTFGVDFGTAAGLDLGQNYGGVPSYGFTRGTGPSVPAPGGGFASVLGDIATLTEAGADIYRTIKGYPARFNTPGATGTRFSGQDLGSFLAERTAERERRMTEGSATSEVEKQNQRDKDMMDTLKQVFENPDVLRGVFDPTAFQGMIDPTKVGVSMDVTPPTPWRPVIPKGLQ